MSANRTIQPVEGSVVTITGGTRSFGSTMAMDLPRKGVGGINIFSRDEANQDAMRRRIHDARARYFIGDIRDADSVQRAVRRDYYRVPLDTHGRGCQLYFDEGNSKSALRDGLGSDNAEGLDVEATKELLLKLPEIQRTAGGTA